MPKWRLESEGPNEIIDKYKGKVLFSDEEGDSCSVGAKNFVLRGCSLQNTKWLIGLCVYSGHETKVMLNS